MAKQNQKTTVAAKTIISEEPVVNLWTRFHKVILLGIMLFAFVLYGNTIQHDYTQDDGIVITDNMFTTKGLAGIPGLLKYDTFYGYFKEAGKAMLVSGGRYRPLTPVMFAVEWQLFGKKPMVGHLLNIFWYGLTGIVLYLLLLKLLVTDDAKQTENRTLMALGATLLFMAHPLHTEAVANIKGRDEIITLLGSLTALYWSMQNFENQSFIKKIMIGVVFFLALMSKENAITFLAIVPMAFYFFKKTSIATALKQTLPLFAAAAVFLLIRGVVLNWQLGGKSMELLNNPFLIHLGNGRWVDMPMGQHVGMILFTLGKYIMLLLFPITLTHDYYPMQVDVKSLGDWRALLSLVVYAALIAVAIWRFKQRDIVSFSILFFLITTSIISNIVFPIGTNMSERFMFMPSVGFCLLLAYGIRHINNQEIRIGLLVALLCTFALKTITRNPTWKSNETLFLTDVNTSTNSAKLQMAAGGILVDKANTETDALKKAEYLKESLPHLEKALELHPTYKVAFQYKGNAYFYLNDFEKAIAAYSEGLKYYPDDKDLTNNLGLAYGQAGKYFGEVKNNLPMAIAYLEKSRTMRPNDPESLRLLAIAYGMSNRNDEAIVLFEKVAQLQPSKEAFKNLSIAYNIAGNAKKAAEFMAKAESIK